MAFEAGELLIQMVAQNEEALAAYDEMIRQGEKTANRLDRLEKQSSQNFGKMGRSAGLMAGAMASAATFALNGLVKLVGFITSNVFSILELGAAAEDTKSKFDTVFGDSVPKANARLDMMAKKLQIGKVQLMQMANQVQDTFVPLGFARDKATDMSLAMTELAQDLSSFSPEAGNAEEAMASLQSALIGNHETMRKYGVIINDTVLSQKLQEMGIKGGTRAANEQQKMLARMKLILEGTKDSQGDLVRTGGSWTNINRSLQSTLNAVGVKIANVLMPAASTLAKGLRDIIQRFSMGEVASQSWSESLVVGAKMGLNAIEGVVNFVMNMDLVWETSKLSAEQYWTFLTDRSKWFGENAFIAVHWFVTNALNIFDDYVTNVSKGFMFVMDNFSRIVHAAMEFVRTGSTKEFQLMTMEFVSELQKTTSSPEFTKFKDTDFTKRWDENAEKWAERMKQKSKQASDDMKYEFGEGLDELFGDIQNIGEEVDKSKKKANQTKIGNIEGAFQDKLLAQFDDKDKATVKAVKDLTKEIVEDNKKKEKRDQELIDAVKDGGFITQG